MLQKISKNKLKNIRQLKQKKYRLQSGLYLISGLRAVQEALSSQHLQVKSVLISESHQGLMNELPQMDCSEIFTLSDQDFKQVVEEKTPQGIALIVRRPQLRLRMEKLPARLLYLERVNDPGNLGTLLRSATWFGWTSVLLSPDSVDPYAPKTVRASAGSIAHLAIYEGILPDDLKTMKKTKGYHLLASAVQGGEQLTQFYPDPKRKVILALGSEAHGLSEDVLTLSDHQLTIPRFGRGESLNLAMAATVFLYHFALAEQKLTSGKEKP